MMLNPFIISNSNKTYLLMCALIMLTACKKLDTAPEPPAETPVVTNPTNPVSQVPAGTTTYDVGTGSGALTIDGSTLKVAANALIRIKAGTYKTITIKNLTGTADKPVLVKNDGQVTVTGSMNTLNIVNVVISGDNSGLTYGIKFENISYRAITMSGKMNGVTLKNMSFKNVTDYTISGDKTNSTGLAYNGTDETSINSFKILNCLFDNAGSIILGGNLNKDTGEDSGLFKSVEIANNIFQNSAGVGSLCSFSNVQDYDIHHNVVNNINQSNNNHNGVFHMQGNGKFHDNKLTNYQGNAIRMWLYSRGTSPATNEIYNNICYNTRKYGGFELQAFTRNIYPGKSTYANAKVYNNTVGQMNTSKDWEGQVLDLYNTFGTLEYYNNLGFNLFTLNSSITNMINNMSDTKIINQTNNKYVTQQEAVNDLTSFSTKIASTGATIL
jgi:hypothetical protein